MARKGKIDLLKDVFSILVCSIILFLFLKGCVVNAILNSPYTKKTTAKMTKYVNKIGTAIIAMNLLLMAKSIREVHIWENISMEIPLRSVTGLLCHR